MANIDKVNKNKVYTQLFKTPVPVEVLWNFLKENFEECDNYFLINKYLYNKCDFEKQLTNFITVLKSHYYGSKNKYIERVMTYKCFLTIIRQICNAHNILYDSKLVYNKSLYEIEYSIYKKTVEQKNG
jgi:hypothetical protein